MSFPKLPTCAPWCKDPHDEPGRYCRANVEDIAALGASTDSIEVNIIRDGGRDFVQVFVTDMTLPPKRREAPTWQVRLRPSDAGVLGDTVRKLDHRGAVTFGHGLFDAMSLINAHACRWDWCEVNHDSLDSPIGVHRSAVVELGGVKMTRHLVEQSGDTPDVTFLRVQYRAHGRWVVDDMEPQEARDRADFLESLGTGDVGDVCAAFRSAAADLGVGE